ncbi:MAG TPA: hypothetical protein VLM16_05035 [Ginsengibacter sp.]|nr:hypothetical protein [Ginsengibacter sp.]
MKTNSTQQEILLLTGTTFSKREWSEKISGNKNNRTEKEQLEDACWNGLLPELLPEIYIHPEGNRKVFLWQIKQGKSFLDVELGDIPEETEKEYSIDPYAFLHFQSLS